VTNLALTGWGCYSASRSRARKKEEREGKDGKAAVRSLHTMSTAGLDNLFETKKSLACN
jgi:hypothetical protein